MGRTFFLMILFGMLAGCAGTTARVEDVSGGQALLKLGSADRATAGEAYEVYRNKRIMYGNPSKETMPTYRQETVGCAKVTEVVDAKHAKAVVHGNVEEHDYARPGATECPIS
ncbi:hypothetical protein LPW11_07105 [Geomonas sp. RF6]|uniref:hypothetical protein n=1 Tax=Geomonas sp. RF6 TaxID=2897342 RepID=UPI001E2AE777|nr:hypothetical protein [Geomonas sp. RF6]UFS71952.1 hypothetical protein LPW11_07105 [Geomonas sp. RF6]